MVRVVAGCCVDGPALIASCAAVYENAAAIAAFRLLAARDSPSTLSRLPSEVVDRIVDWTLGRAMASARLRLESLVGNVDTVGSRPVRLVSPATRSYCRSSKYFIASAYASSFRGRAVIER